jgi:hypothetical protein
MPLRWLQLPLGGIHATTALALAATLERLHFTILLREHRLRVWPPADPDAHADPRTHVRWHAANGTRGRYALPLPLAHNEDGWLVMLAQRVLSNWLGLQSGRDGNRLSARIVNEDEEWVATFDETVSSADARSGHLPRKRYKAVTCLHNFKFASGREWEGVSLFVFHVPDAILWKIDATWDKEKIYLAVWGFVNVAWLKGNLCGEGDGTSKHLNRDFMGEVCVWW